MSEATTQEQAQAPTPTLASVGIVVRASMTTPSRPGKAPRPVWNVDAPPGYVGLMYQLGGSKWRGSFSFWEDPTEKITAALPTYTPEGYGERVEAQNDRSLARADRLEGVAQRRDEESRASFDRAHQIGSVIPFGQPILVGHHSEGRHRRDLDRIESSMRKGSELRQEAEDAANRAEGAERRVARQESPGFCQRRIEEAEAEGRRLRRIYGETPGPRAVGYIAEQDQKAEYWRARLAELGGVKFGPGDIRAGDMVRERRREQLLRVVRVNPKTVSCVDPRESWGWYTPKVPFAEITEVRHSEGNVPTQGGA